MAMNRSGSLHPLTNVLQNQEKVLISDWWQSSEFQHTLAWFKKKGKKAAVKGQKSRRLPTTGPAKANEMGRCGRTLRRNNDGA